MLCRRIIYKYRDDLYKVVSLRDSSGLSFNGQKVSREQKTLDNIRRAARMIEAFGLCNDWDWFFTLTIDQAKFPRNDLPRFRTAVMQLIRNTNRLLGCDIKILLVPELHADGVNYHAHGLISGIPDSELRVFTPDEKLPVYILNKLRSGSPVYDWPRYSCRFGFCDFEPIGNRDAAVRYIKKYISKGLDSTAKSIDVGKHTYFHSKGLKLPEVVWQDDFCTDDTPIPDEINGLLHDSSYAWDYGIADWYKVGD